MHGGNIYKSKVLYDFSANTNPLGLSPGVRKVLCEECGDFEHYPDPDCAELGHALVRRLNGVYKTELEERQLVFGNGASEILYALFGSVAKRKGKARALLVSPCFTGYEEALRASGIERFYFPRGAGQDICLEELSKLMREIRPDILVVTNPNNPDGFLFDRSLLKELAGLCGGTGAQLLIDECFMELTQQPKENSFVPLLKDLPQTVILRAFTKSFALAGLRLGYAICGEAAAQKIKEQIPMWSVSVPAQKAGIAALWEEGYLEAYRRLAKAERKYLAGALEKCGLKVFSSSANFMLFHSGTEDLAEKLGARGILIRKCGDYQGLGKGFYRIAVRKHSENTALIENIAEIIGERANDGQN